MKDKGAGVMGVCVGRGGGGHDVEVCVGWGVG